MKFFVDFDGYCTIEAENAEAAQMEFWRLITESQPLPSNIYEVVGVEPAPQ